MNCFIILLFQICGVYYFSCNENWGVEMLMVIFDVIYSCFEYFDCVVVKYDLVFLMYFIQNDDVDLCKVLFCDFLGI